MLGSHSTRHPHGTLELVFLNGCRTRAMGEAVRRAGVPVVVCWESKVLDIAARLFSRAFFEMLAGGASARHAFDDARRAVLLCTRDWRGKRMATPVYELCDPEASPAPGVAPPLVNGGRTPSGKLAVGLPVLLCDGEGG